LGKENRHVATAKRLYLYVVSAVGLILMVAGAAILLELLLNKVGVGQRSTGGSNSDLNTLSLAIALGLVGLVVWLAHWSIVERMVNGQSDVPAGSTPGAADAAAAERRSIVRSVFLALVTWVSLVYAATLGAGLASRAIADILGASQVSSFSVSSFSVLSLLPIDDAWSLSIIIVLCAIWAYHAWIRSRDVRQGPTIKGAAAWVSRFYLYYAALTGLLGVLENLSSLINTAATQVAQPDQFGFPSDFNLGTVMFTNGGSSAWERPAIAALVGIVIYGAIWLIHWSYSNRLYAGSSEQSSLERSSRVRLAFLMSVLVYGAATMVGGLVSGLGQLFSSGLGVGSSEPLWYVVLVPPAAAVPAGLAWWWHRRRSFAEATSHPEGVSARRIAGYLVALVGLTALAAGLEHALATILGQWWAPTVSGLEITPGRFGNIVIPDSVWKSTVAADGALVLVGVVFWIWPWLFAQRRRAAVAVEREAEIGSSSRAYYLYVIAGAAVLVLAGNAAALVYRLLRLGFGLPEDNLGSEVSGAIAAALVAALILAYHARVLLADRSKPAPMAGAMPGPMPGPMPWPGAPAGGPMGGPMPMMPGASMPPMPAQESVPVEGHTPGSGGSAAAGSAGPAPADEGPASGS
jgi:hypothetical protein